MKQTLYKFQDVCEIVTDYVANGSFKSLAENVVYSDNKDFARLIRLVDFNNNFDEKNAVWVSESSYNFLKKSVLHGDEVIISNVGANLGTVFKCPKLNYPMTLGPNSILVKTNSLCNQNYLYYYLKSKIGYSKLMALVSGSAMPKFNKTDLRNMEISLPKREYQDKIAKILSTLDKKIELNNKLNNNLHQYCIDFFERLFNDFESEDTLENLCYEITRGYTKNYVERSKIINLNQKVNKGELLEKNYYKFLDENQTIPNNKFAKKNDILLNSLGQGTLGRIHLFGEEVNNVVVDQHITVLRTGNRINPYYLYYLLITPEYKNKIESSVTGTTGMLMINISNVRNLRVPIPTREKLDIFEQVVCPIREKITYNNLENEKLSDLRDALLPKLMNGEIDLENIEI